MVNDQNYSSTRQRMTAIFSLNDQRWGRGESREGTGDGEPTSNGSNGPDSETRGVPGNAPGSDDRRASGDSGNKDDAGNDGRPDDGRREGPPTTPPGVPQRGERSQRDRPMGAGDKQGPPDLDDLWREFNSRLQRWFGGGGDNNNGGGKDNRGPRRGGPRFPGAGRGGSIGVIAVLCAVVVIWLGSGLYVVQEGQAGVVLRFGKYVRTVPAGVQWRMPWPFESNETVNMWQVRSIDIGRSGTIAQTNSKDSSMLTADENIIDVRFAVQYRIKDAADFLFNNADAEANVAQAAETAVREIVGKSKMDFVLYEGREQVALELTQTIQKILDSYRDGILVTSVTMQNVQPPQQVQAAFDDAVKAGQDRERQKNEAQAYANNVIPRARGTAARMVEEAEGYKAKVVAQATGDAQRFDAIQAQYAKAPAVTRERMYLDTMQQIYSRASKVLIDGRNNNNLLYLPLDKLLNNNSDTGSGRAARSGASNGTDNGAGHDATPGDASSLDGAPISLGSGLSGGATMSSMATRQRDNVQDDGSDPLRSRTIFRSRDRSESLQDLPSASGQ
ncbi:FtsH protease activity modulator HflK [Robbsia andropogonis]|uniref:FtsH protease activity modulator HflK n=2 Tax=Robbsia andropogonis TaxID=28092 RepID=UPI0021B4A305|nr:FtsH protease activity modulator HflK [Robbsia andropogonis]